MFAYFDEVKSNYRGFIIFTWLEARLVKRWSSIYC